MVLTGVVTATGCGSAQDADPVIPTSTEAGVDPAPPSANDGATPEAPRDDAAADASVTPVDVPSVAIAGVCAQSAQKICAFLNACSPETVGGVFATPAECVPRFESICTGPYPVNAEVRKDEADALLTCLGALTCDALYGPSWSTKCAPPRLETTKPVGASCRMDGECETGACTGSSTQCGACTARLAAGSACTSSHQCPRGGFCSTSCYAPAYLGDSCDTYNPCGNGLKCTATKCVKAGGDGASCSSDLDCDLAQLIECNRTTKKCEKVAFAEPGDSCPYPFAGSPVRCVKGSHCIGDSPAQAGTCVAPQKIGETCGGDQRCENLINCRNGKCVLPTYVACP